MDKYLEDGENVIIYKSVDGNDVIISLMGAENLSAVNIVGEETPIDTNFWTISGTTTKYGTSGNTLVTVKGVKILDGI